MVKTLLLCVGLILGAYAAADMTGTWNVTVETDQGSGTPSFDLVEDNGKLTGTYTGMMGSAPVTGTVEGDTFKLVINVEAQGQSMSIEYSGSMTDENTIEGKLDMAGFADGTFTGKKQ